MMKLIRLILPILLIIALILPLGCRMLLPEYRAITVKSQFCHYQVEYPQRRYVKHGPETHEEYAIPTTDLTFSAPEVRKVAKVMDLKTGKISKQSGWWVPSYIGIAVFDPTEYFGEPKTAKWYIEGTISNLSSWKNFKVLENTQAMVSGINVLYLSYFIDPLMPIPKEDGENLSYRCEIYFEHNGFIWCIDGGCDQDIMMQFQADFDHVVNSFKILE
jgi:hypothetical protein